MCIHTRQSVVVLIAFGLFGIVGCYTTGTKAQVDEVVQRNAGNSLGSKLVPNGSDDTYDYYLVETAGGNILERYRIPRDTREGT